MNKEKTFLNVWKELEDVPFDESDSGQLELSIDFYGCNKGDSNLDVWVYLESVFNGLVIGEVLNMSDQELESSKYANLVASL